MQALLQLPKIQELARCSGPCITIFLPPFRPGEQAPGAASTMLRNFVQEAASRLETLPREPLDKHGVEDLLEALRGLEGSPTIEEGCHWSRAFFRAAGVL